MEEVKRQMAMMGQQQRKNIHHRNSESLLAPEDEEDSPPSSPPSSNTKIPLLVIPTDQNVSLLSPAAQRRNSQGAAKVAEKISPVAVDDQQGKRKAVPVVSVASPRNTGSPRKMAVIQEEEEEDSFNDKKPHSDSNVHYSSAADFDRVSLPIHSAHLLSNSSPSASTPPPTQTSSMPQTTIIVTSDRSNPPAVSPTHAFSTPSPAIAVPVNTIVQAQMLKPPPQYLFPPIESLGSPSNSMQIPPAATRRRSSIAVPPSGAEK
jgi:hypothetical protein